MNKIIEGLNFQPWIPEKYGDLNNPYGKLLLIGESHYGADGDIEESNDDLLPKSETNNFTSEIVALFLTKTWDCNFYRNLGLAFNKENRYDIWNHAAFANAIQVSLIDSSSKPNKEEIATVKAAIWLLIENLKPDKIIFCSQGMWKSWLPDDDSRCKLIKNLKADTKESNVWSYENGQGFSYAIGINHPSRGFAYSAWTPLIKEFITTSF